MENQEMTLRVSAAGLSDEQIAELRAKFDKICSESRVNRTFWEAHAFSFNRERIGFRSSLFCFVWYLRRWSIEIWIGKRLILHRG